MAPRDQPQTNWARHPSPQEETGATLKRYNGAQSASMNETPIAGDASDCRQILRKYYQAIQRREGDERLREMLSAERAVTRLDRKMTPRARMEWLEALRRIEQELLLSSQVPGTS